MLTGRGRPRCRERCHVVLRNVEIMPDGRPSECGVLRVCNVDIAARIGDYAGRGPELSRRGGSAVPGEADGSNIRKN